MGEECGLTRRGIAMTNDVEPFARSRQTFVIERKTPRPRTKTIAITLKVQGVNLLDQVHRGGGSEGGVRTLTR